MMTLRVAGRDKEPSNLCEDGPCSDCKVPQGSRSLNRSSPLVREVLLSLSRGSVLCCVCLTFFESESV